ncbi:glycosyltransferase family 9 protein [Opitutales bacterium ASA1]|uniref:glycosyltransferase family 9 protein n=1 Tax=Congregicoccus parvus TaxID=3081749 RepID=UPI002B302F06|nr:glycosyltransferase family 9 protein [Opitutales bacterium ASA1]
MPDILVVKPSSFGDIVHGLQVAETIRRGVPDARIDWVAASAFAPLVRACATVERVHEFRRRGGVRAFFALVREVRRRRYDYVLDMQGLARSALLTRLARGGVKIGRRDGREGARGLCPRVVDAPRGGWPAHAIEVLLPFAGVFGLEPQLRGRLEFPRAGRTCDAAFVAPTAGPTLVVFPESRRVEKNWPGFAEFAEALLERVADARIVWSGRVPKNRASLEAYRRGGRFIDADGRIALDELPAVFAAADWVLANDSGPMHLAAAMDVRALAVFGPTDPARFGPWPPGSDRHRVVRAPGGDLSRLEPREVVEILLAAGSSDERRSTRGVSPV